MKIPQYREILKGKIDYYGQTEAAYEFAAEEYARQFYEYMKVRDRAKTKKA